MAAIGCHSDPPREVLTTIYPPSATNVNVTRRPRIAYFSVNDPQDRRAWSGISYYMVSALQTHCGDVTVIRPSSGSPRPKVYRRITRSIRYGLSGGPRLRPAEYDVIFAPQSAPALAFLRGVDKPIVFVSDSTWNLYHNYYRHSYQAPWKSWGREILERIALRKSSLLLYPSEWAARSALLDYGINPEKIRVIPFGANIDNVPPADRLPQKDISQHCNLLFVGVDWERKGGAIAVEALHELCRLGINAKLTICGCVPPRDFLHNRVTVIPSLDKRKPEDRKKLNQLFEHAHFLLVPTRADCFGIVFCEGNAYGVPAITTDTGGVSGVVKSGINGYMLPVTAAGVDYGHVICDLYRDNDAYHALVHSSRRLYDELLNWDVWGLTARDAIMGIL
jgi:glycosyltransferase involved in cell wall biosynthesis